uniref:Microphthalmia associated trancription factor n=1 Tax=Halocynthia roretzi TaxID=7729 RepID=Q8WSV7_HALRO|nr:microphthalmia associated trancription factor [Halocynthia roretzi]
MSSLRRIDLKMQLQKAQAESLQRNLSNAGNSSTFTSTPAISLPRIAVSSAGVPGEVLQVQTMLENPTRYHVAQKQRSQVVEYLSNSVGNTKVAVNQMLRPHNSLPSNANMIAAPGQGLSAPASPLARLNLSSSTDQHLDEIIDDLELNSAITLSTYSASTTTKLPIYDQNTTSSSCPEIIPKQEYLEEDVSRAFVQDRVKKDNHNRIERKRRYNINDRIKELGSLIPRSNDPDIRWNKGSILKTTVDYVRDLQKRVAKLDQSERREKAMQNRNRRLTLRIQELEILAKTHGLNLPPWQEQPDVMNTLFPSDVNNTSFDVDAALFTKQEEIDVANFPNRQLQNTISPTFSPAHVQQQYDPFTMQLQQQQQQQQQHQQHSPNNAMFSQVSPHHSHSPFSAHEVMFQQTPQKPQHIVSIDVSSPAPSISPLPQNDMATMMQTSNVDLVALDNVGGVDGSFLNLQDTSSFSSLLNDTEGMNLEELLMEDDSTPIKSDIFLSEALQK